MSLGLNELIHWPDRWGSNFNSLTSGRYSCNLKLVNFKLISQIDTLCNFCDIAPRPRWWFVNIGSGNGLVPSATSHYLSQCWLRFILPYCVTGPQRVKSAISEHMSQIKFLGTSCGAKSVNTGNKTLPVTFRAIRNQNLNLANFSLYIR